MYQSLEDLNGNPKRKQQEFQAVSFKFVTRNIESQNHREHKSKGGKETRTRITRKDRKRGVKKIRIRLDTARTNWTEEDTGVKETKILKTKEKLKKRDTKWQIKETDRNFLVFFKCVLRYQDKKCPDKNCCKTTMLYTPHSSKVRK